MTAAIATEQTHPATAARRSYQSARSSSHSSLTTDSSNMAAASTPPPTSECVVPVDVTEYAVRKWSSLATVLVASLGMPKRERQVATLQGRCLTVGKDRPA